MAMQLYKPRIQFIVDQRWVKALFFLRSQLPILAMEKVSKIPGLTTSTFRKNISDLKMVYSKIDEMYDLFEHFMANQWVYENKKIFEYDN